MERLKALWAKDTLRVIGLMSGTSADGMDAALTEITGCGVDTRVRLLGFVSLPYPDEIRKEILPTDIQVALTHTPLTREYVADLVSWGGKEDTFSMRYASLILAGHYNGGQWRLPFVGAVHVPELGWFPEDSLVQGLSYLEGIPQYVSPGLGSDPHYEYQPGRVFNPPVMTRIVLTRRAK